MSFFRLLPSAARRATLLGALKAGDQVNLEIDMLARYLARWQETA